PHATFTPTIWLHACQNARHRNFTQLIPRGSQRRAHASSECHHVRKPSETRQRTSTRPALRFDSAALSRSADIWTAWVNAPRSSQAVRLLNISRQGREEERREPSSGSSVTSGAQPGWGRFAVPPNTRPLSTARSSS